MAIITPAAFAWALIPSAAGGWLLLLALAATGSWQALVRKRPLVGGSDAAPEPALPDAAPPRRLFGRRRPQSDARTGGQAGVRQCRSWGSPCPKQKKRQDTLY